MKNNCSLIVLIFKAKCWLDIALMFWKN